MSFVLSPEAGAERLQDLVTRRHIPRATYRLQFNDAFTFEDARRIVDYLAELGISDCYASPLLRACSGSTHGYDICDYHQLNPAMGGAEGFEAFSAALRGHGMGLLLDVVPNHMGIGEPANTWWMDVLENGPGSSHAAYFDIDWQPVKRELENKVLLPILEDQYGKVLEAGKLRLRYEDGAFFLDYYETQLPIAPLTYGMILGHHLPQLGAALGKANNNFQELESIMTAISYLPPRTETAPEKIAERSREKEIIKRRIAALHGASPEVRAAIDATIEEFNGRVGEPHSFDALDRILADQAYRPAFWRVATEEINYRRFFDINKLAAIRIELPEVFLESHELIFRLIAAGKVNGLRVDHPDGLWNPVAYFRRLQDRFVYLQTSTGQADSLDGATPPEEAEQRARQWLDAFTAAHAGQTVPWPLYVVAEKILSGEESLADDWAVSGTTGYEYLALADGLCIDPAARKDFDRTYTQFIGRDVNFADLINTTKKMIMTASLASEINALSHQLERLAEHNRLYRDFTLNSLSSAIREVVACLPVYRTYIVDSTSRVEPHDERYVLQAVVEARRRNTRLPSAVFDFVRDTLLLRNMQDFGEADRASLFQFVMKFQQVTGPVMAKGLEDTAFYIYNRLVSLNEVGGHPLNFGTSLEKFHTANRARLIHWPHSLLAGTTHDTKRSEDVRARLAVLSEMPGAWRATVNRWARLNARKKTNVDGEPAPCRNDEYLLYQTLVGALPWEPLTGETLRTFRERIAAYMQKATKEAKTHTSWISPNEHYDTAVREFVERLLPDKPGDRFIDQMVSFARHVAFFGQFNSLALALLRMTVPGVPDIYQGSELWALSLVDPDNRRPVDYEQRRAWLADLKARIAAGGEDLAPLAGELLAHPADGRVKLYLIYRALRFRKDREPLFREGDYVPLEGVGPRKHHLCAFLRRRAGEECLVVVPRLVTQLAGGIEQPPLGEELWRETRLRLPEPARGATFRNLFTGEKYTIGPADDPAELPVGKLLSVFPVALLERLHE